MAIQRMFVRRGDALCLFSGVCSVWDSDGSGSSNTEFHPPAGLRWNLLLELERSYLSGPCGAPCLGYLCAGRLLR